ncbi:MAG: YqaA family protein [Rhodospirillaceae bacterium]|nr:YqaA family protein [Rhodospirillaceae bacterium]
MIRRLYDFTISLSIHPRAIWALAIISFIESSIFPIPPDVLIIAMVIAAPTQAWRIAAVASVASVLGGYAGYGIGYFLYETVGRAIVAFYGYEAQFESFRGLYEEWGFWIVAGAGFTPFPYKVITIASGAANLDIWTFGVASAVSRSARFFLVAALLWKFGAPIRYFVERYLNLLTVVFFVLLIGGFVAIKYMF